MKSFCAPIVVLSILILPAGALLAQPSRERAFLKGTVIRTVGTTPIKIRYGSPRVADRKIWGQLHPFGENWIAGAGEMTRIEFAEDVKVNGNDLAAGVYRLYVLLRSDDDWQLVFNRDVDGSSNDFDTIDDMLRIAVRPQDAPHRERLKYGIEDVRDKKPYRAKLYLHWEKKKVAVNIEMTGRRTSVSWTPKIPKSAEAPWAVVQASLDSFAAEDIETTIQDFAEDFETDFGDGGSTAAYAQMMNNMKRGGMLEGMHVNLNELEMEIDDSKALFKNISIQAPFGSPTLNYELEQRDGSWVVTSIISSGARQKR